MEEGKGGRLIKREERRDRDGKEEEEGRKKEIRERGRDRGEWRIGERGTEAVGARQQCLTKEGHRQRCVSRGCRGRELCGAATSRPELWASRSAAHGCK